MGLMSRDTAARLGRESLAILRGGGYSSPSGAWVDVRSALRAASQGTVEYPPDVPVPSPQIRGYSTVITVENDTTLRVSRRLAAEGRVAALNFANAEYPGGGFLEGARAQEESLARSSGLYECLKGCGMYAFHRAQRDAIYTNYVIYSPGVPIIREDGGELLDEPWLLSILTSPAANQRDLEIEAPERVVEIRAAMTERVLKVLGVAALRGYDRLVLGAWGCGAFGIPGEVMAPIFRDALLGPFKGVFRVVVFAITDWSEERRFISPFERAFAIPERLRLGARELMAAHPPDWQNANKRIVFEISSPPGSIHGGSIGYSRWGAMTLPSCVDLRAGVSRLQVRPGFYDYASSAVSGMDWHVNFADPSLFHFYGGGLFAQDEIQAVEHPALGALREALLARGMKALTVERGEATPVLVVGVERRCQVATEPDRAAGRPHGLYGSAFAAADRETIIRATKCVSPPTVTNLICMAAPRGGPGVYSRREIEHVLVTAFTAFRAAVLESGAARSEGLPRGVVIHTGWWGCGAFGGSRVLMAALQMLAAEMAGVEQLVFHSGWPADTESLKEAVGVLEGLANPSGEITAAAAIEALESARFVWGVGNGT